MKRGVQEGNCLSWRGTVSACLLLFSSTIAFAFQVEVSEAPINNLELTTQAIKSAKKSILLNIYELSSPEIAAALESQAKAGVHIEVLLEGQPVGGISAPGKAVANQLIQSFKKARGKNQFFEMSSKAGAHRRFRFDHAKYAVIDGESLLIGSENYSPTGNPVPGNVGNRGWEVFVHQKSVAQHFAKIFAQDTDMSHGDLFDRIHSDTLEEIQSFDFSTLASRRTEPVETMESSDVQIITSPDTSKKGLVDLINGAEESIDIEQMTFDSEWGKSKEQSPLLKAVLAAAKRGVKVRVLLNDERVFRTSKPKNTVTAGILNQAAKKGNLDIEAQIADLKAMGVDYIHNKGMLIDGRYTVVSSINWGQNAVENNREAAVVIDSPEIYDHYESLFDRDWSVSGGSEDGSEE